MKLHVHPVSKRRFVWDHGHTKKRIYVVMKIQEKF